ALVEAGALVDKPDRGGLTALAAAVEADAHDVVRYLLSVGAESVCPEPELCTALRTASEPVIRELLDHGFEPDVAGSGGWTPLMIAAERGDEALVRLLLERGADPTRTLGERFLDAVLIAVAAGREEAAWVLQAASVARLPAPEVVWTRIGERLPAGLAANWKTGRRPPPIPDPWRTLDPHARAQLTLLSPGRHLYAYRTLALAEAVDIGLAARETEPGQLALDPEEPLERVWFSPHWVPVAIDRDGRLLAVDVDPPAGGIHGQVLHWSPDFGPVGVVASSLGLLLLAYLRRLEAGVSLEDLDRTNLETAFGT
ncbi:MAG: ankyrin repeat domain-containing protein, partial [Myxococcales bacterium]|nr:ankyrin repeat domain-containing protein [Myxococcales bacterium]